MTKKLYKVAYFISPGEFEKEYLDKNLMGGCDAIIIHTILYPKDGSRFENIQSLGPDKKVLSDNEMFMSWANMGKMLSNSPGLSEFRKDFCRSVFEYAIGSVKKLTEEEKK